MKIIDNTFKEKMDQFNSENELGLTDYECSCYANCLKVMCELANNKISFEDMFFVYYFFDDVAAGKRPDIMIMTDEYFDIYKLTKRYSTTKELTDSERKILAFALYYAICIKGFDEEKKEGRLVNPPDNLTFDKAKQILSKEEYLEFCHFFAKYKQREELYE